jgi:PPOX class probable F420-dependent enzyme
VTIIPDSYRDLLERPIVVSLATVMPDGQPQVTPVWVDLVDGKIRMNTVVGRQKERNLSECKQATVLAIDPDNPLRFMEIRGEAAPSGEDDGIVMIDKLSKDYLNIEPYPWRNPADTRITFLITPLHDVVSG